MKVKNFLVFLFAFFCCIATYAYDFKSGNIYYEISGSNTVAVTNSGSSIGYSGNIIIPASVTYNGSSYSVTSIGNSAFLNCSGLTSVTIPNSVTSIGERAFEQCSVTSVAIPNSVTSIEWHAFAGCSGLTSVTIPNSVTFIAYYAFCDCTSLTSIVVESGNTVYDSRNNCNAIIKTASNELIAGCKNTIIPNGVTSIGNGAFGGCSGLTSVTIPNSVTNIGNFPFSNCISLTSIVVESGNTVYDSRNNCNAIIKTASNELIAGCKNTIIPNSVTSIGRYAFDGCSGLTSVTIPNSVTSIGYAAFNGCSGLTSVTIPNSVTSIGRYAFYRCSGLSSVTILNETPPSIDAYTFPNRANCTLYVLNKEAYENADYWKEFKEIKVYDGPYEGKRIGVGSLMYKIVNVISESNIEVAVTYADSENDYANNGDYYSGDITIPSTTLWNGVRYKVVGIDDNAFRNCKNLTKVTIPNSVTSIGSSAFYGCSGLTSVTIPNSVTSIGSCAFQDCGGLTSVTIPNSVTSIGNYAFENCSGLTSVTIPNSVTNIGSYAFQNCSGLTSVTIPNSVTSIGYSAFYGCTGLTSVTIPNSVTSIGNFLFAYCSSLTSIVVESGNTVYDSRNNCNAIINTASNELIIGCKNTIIPNSVTSIGYSAFSGCTGLTSVTIPNSVTSIGRAAFSYCSGLTSVTIPNSVTSIGEFAFYGCSGLTSVTIPNSVTSIGEEAFAYLNQAIDITMESETPITITDNVFTGTTKNILRVPRKSRFLYANTDVWKDFNEHVATDYVFELADMRTWDLVNQQVKRFNITGEEGRNNVVFTGGPGFEPVLCPITVEAGKTYELSVDYTGPDIALYGSGDFNIIITDKWQQDVGTSDIGMVKIPATAVTNEHLSFSFVAQEEYNGVLINFGYVDDGTTYEFQFNNWRLREVAPGCELKASNVTGRHGSAVNIPVILKNPDEYGGLQCQVTLPEGVTLNKVNKTNRLNENHTLSTNKIGGNTYQVLIYTGNRTPITGNDGALFTMTVDIADDMEDGVYPVKIAGIEVSDIDLHQSVIADSSSELTIDNSIIPGDATDDGRVNVTDILAVANYILQIPMTTFNEQAADVNGDGRINVTDLLGIANIILQGNNTSNAPAISEKDPQ